MCAARMQGFAPADPMKSMNASAPSWFPVGSATAMAKVVGITASSGRTPTTSMPG